MIQMKKYMIKMEKYYKVLSDIPIIDSYDKNGNKLDGKCSCVIANFQKKEVFDKNGNKVLVNQLEFIKKMIQIKKAKKYMIEMEINQMEFMLN